MARQTRSANGHIEPIEDENEQLNNVLDNKTNLSSKKRKRNSNRGWKVKRKETVCYGICGKRADTLAYRVVLVESSL